MEHHKRIYARGKRVDGEKRPPANRRGSFGLMGLHPEVSYPQRLGKWQWLVPVVAFFPSRKIFAPELWSLHRLRLASIFSVYSHLLQKPRRRSEAPPELPLGGKQLKNFQGLTLELRGAGALWLPRTHPYFSSQLHRPFPPSQPHDLRRLRALTQEWSMWLRLSQSVHGIPVATNDWFIDNHVT